MHRRAFSLIGLLVTLVCVVVLFAIGMNAMNKAVTGGGSPKGGTVRSTQDMMNLQAIHMGLFVEAGDHNGLFITPSIIAASGGGGLDQRRLRAADMAEYHPLDTSASMWSALIQTNAIAPKQLISGNEYSGYVDEYYSYDHHAYDPIAGIYWDSGFKADLKKLSHTSFAHVPLHGKRSEKNWNTSGSAMFPIFGNRGPKDGIDNPSSMSYGRDGLWGGHLVFGDGHVAFVDTFTPPNLQVSGSDGMRPDNIFAVEDGSAGADAIVSFTQEMTADGPVLQFD